MVQEANNAVPEIEVQLDPEDVIILLLEANERILGKKTLRGITRLEKLVFLLSQETTFTGIASLFVFRPYLFGPHSEEVASAISFLEGMGLVDVSTNSFTLQTQTDEEFLSSVEEEKREYIYKLTDQGRRVAAYWRNALPESDKIAIDKIVRRYGTMALTQLIRYVYSRYPDSAVKSIHPEARRLRSNDGD